MRKVKLGFHHPMALGYSTKWVRGRFFLVHYLLGVGFLLDPLFLLVAGVIAAGVLLLETWQKTPFATQNVLFAWQRVAFCMIVGLFFLGTATHGHTVAVHWWWASMVFAAVCFYDGYLAFRGITGIGFIKFKE